VAKAKQESIKVVFKVLNEKIKFVNYIAALPNEKVFRIYNSTHKKQEKYVESYPSFSRK
jgi:hypothetical protein